MSTPLTSQDFESYVPVYDTVPEKWDDAREFLVEHLKKISNAVNAREIGFFLDEELLSGKAFIPGITVNENPQTFRSMFRMVVDFGALPNAGTKSVAHNITVDDNFTLIQLYAAATDPIGFTSIPIPYSSATLNKNIEINMDVTDINITTAINYSNYTRCFIVIEYILEL